MLFGKTKKPEFVIRDAHPHEIPDIVECAASAFTKFTVFGPPWYDDAFILPASLLSMPVGFSRVAVELSTGRVLGHAQWTGSTMHLAGQEIKSAILAPLSVLADFQDMGIGTALMQDGIRLLQADGIQLLLVLGHEHYYPRFGFQTGCHGRHGLTIPLPQALSQDPEGWELRPVEAGDEEHILIMWEQLCGSTDGALFPGVGLLPWTSKTRGIISCVLTHDGNVQGHARFDLRPECRANTGMLRFLAANAQAAQILAARIAAWAKWPGTQLFLPLPDSSPAVQALFEGWTDSTQAHYECWPAGMALSLAPAGNKPDIPKLLADIKSGKAPPLFVEWSPLFDF